MKQLLLILLLALSVSGFSQKVNKEVLFTIDGKPYFTDEFERVYKKNLELVKDESQKDLNQYLELFIGYKLKINKAYKLGLQDGKKYLAELKTNREQLAKKYTTDSKVTQALVEEAFKRGQNEVKASHILLNCNENATPEDSLKVYNQIIELKKRTENGEDFSALAEEFSQDPSAKENKGNLGYFSTFRMLYSFESAAFNTPIGKISKPIRTRFGYHIIKVDDIRPNRGEVQVAHIMIANPTPKSKEGQSSDNKEVAIEDQKEIDPADIEKVKKSIQDIYTKIQQGENFEALAKQFSEDKASAPKGGVLSKFSSGQLSSDEFENTAFSLTKEKPISEPFQTRFGWHIVKLIERFPLKNFDESKADLENKIARDDRSRLIAASMTEKLKKKYVYKTDKKQYEKVVKQINDKFYEGTWEVPKEKENIENTKPILTIEKKNFDGDNFLNYVKNFQKTPNSLKPLKKLIDSFYTKYVDEQLNQYYRDNLDNEIPEFAAVINEYKDGLLLFDLMEKEIWEKSKNDSIGLQKFYENNIAKYQWKKRYDVCIASSTKEDVIKNARKMLLQGKTPEQLKEKLDGKKGEVNIMTKTGVFEEDNENIPQNVKFEVGVSEIYKQGDYNFTAKVNKVIPAGAKTLEECKGKVINDYQQYLEDNWVKELKNEFKVEIKENVFQNIKTQLKS